MAKIIKVINYRTIFLNEYRWKILSCMKYKKTDSTKFKKKVMNHDQVEFIVKWFNIRKLIFVTRCE